MCDHQKSITLQQQTNSIYNMEGKKCSSNQKSHFFNAKWQDSNNLYLNRHSNEEPTGKTERSQIKFQETLIYSEQDAQKKGKCTIRLINPVQRQLGQQIATEANEQINKKTEAIAQSSLQKQLEQKIYDSISLIQLAQESQLQQNTQIHKKPIRLRLKQLIQKYKDCIYLMITIIGMIQIGLSFRFYIRNAKCEFDSQSQCLKQVMIPLFKNTAVLIPILIIDSIFQLFILLAFIYKFTHRAATLLGLIQIIVLSYIAGFQFNSRNIVGIIQLLRMIIISILILLLGLITIFRYFYKKSKKGTIIVYIFIFSLLLFKDYCSNWKQGINGQIQNKEGSCPIKPPMCSFIRLMLNLNPTFAIHNCFFGNQYKQRYDKKFSIDINNGSIIGFSNLKGVREQLLSKQYIMQTVVDHAKRYKTIKQAKQANESEVIFDTNAQQYHIEVIYNQTLARQRQQKWENNQNSSSPSLAKNVLFLFLDAVSRYETKLALPKFVKWFQKNSKYHSYKDEPQKVIQQQKIQRQAYQFYKYHSLGYFTYQNVYAMFYGKRVNQMLRYKASNISKDFRFESWHKDFMQRGYVVGYTSTYIASSTSDLYERDLKPFRISYRDHSCLSFNQDPNFFQRQNLQFGITKGLSASTDRCLYHKRLSEYSFQYAISFFDKYRNSAKLFEINLVEGHDFFGGSIKYLDDTITLFLQEMEAKGYLDDTIVVALSDHGSHRGQAFKTILYDHLHPFVYISIPQKMNKKYREKIRFNQQNLMTAFNVYHFMQTIARGEEYENKNLGLLQNLKFQTDCDKANIIQNQDSACYCQGNN